MAIFGGSKKGKVDHMVREEETWGRQDLELASAAQTIFTTKVATHAYFNSDYSKRARAVAINSRDDPRAIPAVSRDLNELEKAVQAVKQKTKQIQSRAEWVEKNILAIRQHPAGANPLTTLAQQEAAIINYCKSIDVQLNAIVAAIRALNIPSRWKKVENTGGFNPADPAEAGKLYHEMEAIANHLIALRSHLTKCHELERDAAKILRIAIPGAA